MRTLDSLHVECEHPEHHVSQVAHARKGNQSLQIGLHHRDQCAVDDSYDRQDGDNGRRSKAAFGKRGMANRMNP